MSIFCANFVGFFCVWWGKVAQRLAKFANAFFCVAKFFVSNTLPFCIDGLQHLVYNVNRKLCAKHKNLHEQGVPMKTQQRICTRICLFAISLVLFSASFAGWIGITPQIEASAATTGEGNYYANLNESLTGDDFRAQLATLITSTHKTQTTYDGLREVFKQSDADPNKPGNILLFYTGKSVPFSGSFNDGINREHVWPKNNGSAFPASSEAGSDAHHLRPCDSSLNSTRSNNSFGEVPQTNANVAGKNGVYFDSTNLCYQASTSDGTLFYPGEGYRGATARILMYLQVRWGDKYSLSFVDRAGNNKTIGKISDLMKWHLQEPPTEEEIYRNNVVAGIQGNRNPFIDHPEYAEKIYCYDGESYNNVLKQVVAQYGNNNAQVESITINPSTISVVAGQSVSLGISLSPSNAKNDLVWTTSNSAVATVASGVVKGVANGTATITAYSQSNPSVKATATVTVKSVKSIAVSGTPTQTSYYAGENFNPAGLKVVATYSDGTTATIANDSCSWLDATTRQTALSKGSTSVLCVLGNLEQTVHGITVSSVQMKSFDITRSSFSGSGAYAWQTWTSDGISGKAFMYGGNTSAIQMNSSKSYYYIYNTTELPGSLLTITITSQSEGKNVEILTSNTPFTPGSSKIATGGTSHGIKTVGAQPTTWTINTTDKYFAINYKSTGVWYIESISVSYGEAEQQEHVHNYGSWQAEVPATCQQTGTVGHYYCQGCNTYFNANKQEITNLTIAKADHSLGAWNQGYAGTCVENGQVGHYQCTVCNKYFDSNKNPLSTIVDTNGQHSLGAWNQGYSATCVQEGQLGHYQCTLCNKYFDQNKQQLSTIVVPAGNCQLNNWVEEQPSTCQQHGTMAHFLCTVCGKTYNEQGTLVTDLTLPLGECSFGEWEVDQEATCKKAGSKHTTCLVCGQTKTEQIDKLDHNYGEWQVALQPTLTSKGEEQRTCQDCGGRQSREVDPLTPTQAFQPYVDQLGVGTMQQQFQAINNALAFYNSLSAEQQVEVATQRASLQQAMDDYNTTVQNVNDVHQQASNVANAVVCAQAVALLAICAFVVGKRFF